MKCLISKFNKFSVAGKVSIVIILITIILAIFGNKMAVNSYKMPSGDALESPSSFHIFGTDDLGIDIWAEMCAGARTSFTVGFGAAILTAVIGSSVGIIAGYFGGMADKILMRIIDAMIVIPDFPTMIVLGAFFGPSVRNIIIVLCLVSWPMPARIVRSKVISLKEEKFILASKSYGASFWHISTKHFFPYVFPIIMVTVIKLISRAIVSEASLSFLGLGDPTSKSWGLILNHALNFKGIYYTDYWKWWVMTPLIAIMIIVLAFSTISRDLEKITNTKL